jgi:hypothetical protein
MNTTISSHVLGETELRCLRQTADLQPLYYVDTKGNDSELLTTNLQDIYYMDTNLEVWPLKSTNLQPMYYVDTRPDALDM